MNLKGKTALVTGGARGIGKAIAMKLARQGANIAILDVALAEDTVREIEALGVKAMSVEANVTKLESVEQAIEQVIFGPLIYLSTNRDAWPVSVALSTFNGIYGSRPQLIQAGSLMTLILHMILFFVAQRFFIQGIVITGVEK